MSETDHYRRFRQQDGVRIPCRRVSPSLCWPPGDFYRASTRRPGPDPSLAQGRLVTEADVTRMFVC